MTSRSLLALLFVSLLACGGAAPPAAAHSIAMPPTSLRAATEAERDAARAAITAEHGEGSELLHVEAAGTPSRVLVIYAHADVPTAPNARQRVCGAAADPAPVTLRLSCRYLAIARLGTDTASLDARLELGSWCDGDADAGTFEMYAGDFDADGRDEVSLMVGTRASYVFDVATFGVQLAAPGIDYQLEYPDGTRLARRGEVRYDSFDFEDGFPDPMLRMNEGETLGVRRTEPLVEDETPFEFFAYDAAADCWHLPASTVEAASL